MASTLYTPTLTYKQKFHVIDNETYERKFVHKFTMPCYDDAEVMVAEPIYKWQQTDKGLWVMKHGIDHVFHLYLDPAAYNQNVMISAMITPKRWTEFCLRWP